MRIGIIGGGVIGLTTAYALTAKGYQIDLFEQHKQIAMEASFANGGQLSYRYVAPLADAGIPQQMLHWMLQRDPPLRFRPRMDPAQWRWCLRFLLACRHSINRANTAHLLRLALYSQAVLSDWRVQHGLDGFAWRANGKLVIYRHPASLRKAAGELSDLSAQQRLDARQCAELEPALASQTPPLQGGIFSPGDEVGDCYLFCRQLLKRLLADLNFTLHTGHTVKTLRPEHGRIHILFQPGGDMAVDHLVIAAGLGSVALLRPLGPRLPLYPLKGYSLTLPVLNSTGAPRISVTDYDNKTVYARLDERLRVAAMVDIGDRDPGPDTGRIALLRRQAGACFPLAGNYQQAKAWAGLRPATPEGIPWLGHSGIHNLWLNLGHGSLGFTLACGSAAVLASLIDGNPPAISLKGLQPAC